MEYANAHFNILTMVEFKGRLYLATERRVYVLNDDNKFEPLSFVTLPPDSPMPDTD